MAKFQAGQSGNPNGKPKGAINRRTQLAKLLEPHAEGLIAKAVELAQAGDVTALKLCLDKLLPRPKDEAIAFALPAGDLKKCDTLLLLGERLLQAVAAGEITPEQGRTLTVIAEAQRKAIEITQLEARINSIETELKHPKDIHHAKPKQNSVCKIQPTRAPKFSLGGFG